MPPEPVDGQKPAAAAADTLIQQRRGPIKKIVQLVADSWQLITAAVGIATLIGAGLGPTSQRVES